MSELQQIQGRIHRKGQIKKVKIITLEKEIMTPENERWDEFTSRLEGEEGCDFKEKEKEGTLKSIKVPSSIEIVYVFMSSAILVPVSGLFYA